MPPIVLNWQSIGIVGFVILAGWASYARKWMWISEHEAFKADIAKQLAEKDAQIKTWLDLWREERAIVQHQTSLLAEAIRIAGKTADNGNPPPPATRN